MKERVICFTDHLGNGGAQRQLVGLACMLKEKGYDVSVVLYYNNPFYKPMLDEAGIKSVIVKNSNYIVRIWSIFKYFRKHKGASIIAYQETPSLISCMLRPFIKCRKLIVSERNTTQTLTKMDKLRFWLYRFADYVVPNSYSQAEFLRKTAPKLKHKIVPITNFVDTEYFKPAQTSDFSTKRTNTVVVIGRDDPQKNFHRFIDAIKILADERINIHAKWYGITKKRIEEFKAYVKNQGLSSYVDIYEPTLNISEAYISADFFCLPSLFEGFPNVLCEAISSGLPVACSNVCDNPYIMSKVDGGIMFNPLDVEDIADKLKQLILISNEEWLKYATMNRQVAVESFSKEAFIDKYCRLL